MPVFRTMTLSRLQHCKTFPWSLNCKTVRTGDAIYRFVHMNGDLLLSKFPITMLSKASLYDENANFDIVMSFLEFN